MRIAFLFLLLCAGTGFTQEKPTLRWGMDETGGAPYVYDNQTKGFEVELARYLAGQIGRTSEPVSGDWSKLPELLRNGELDIVLNGYEYSEQFRDFASVPYYVYRLGLVVHRDSGIRDWTDLRAKPGQPKKTVLVLQGSAAQRYLENRYGDDINLRMSDDVASAFDLVANQQNADATVQDNPAVAYYLQADAEQRLQAVGAARAPGLYVILTRPTDRELRQQINAAIRQGVRDGSLRRIYEKYGLATPDQDWLLFLTGRDWPPPPGAFPAWETIPTPEETTASVGPIGQSPKIQWSLVAGKLLSGAGMTIFLAVTSFPLAVQLGLLLAIARVYGPRGLAILAAIYVEVIRGTPLLLQLFFIFYLLPRLMGSIVAVSIPPELAGILGLAINYAAYEAENYRAGLLAIPRGQMEAALALGMTRQTAIRRIVVPQAVRIVLPPVTNDFIALFKDTSVCSVILITELTRQYNVLYNNHRDQIIILAALTALLYLAMSYPQAVFAQWLDRKFARGEKGTR